MKNWSRIKESYDGGFAEMYLDLYKFEYGFVIKGTSYHYNAGAEKLLCEISIPTAFITTKGILQFIADNHSKYSWAKFSPDELEENKDLVAFINANIIISS